MKNVSSTIMTPHLNMSRIKSALMFSNGTQLNKTEDIFIARYIQNLGVFKEMMKYRSKNAVWAALCVTFLLVLLLLAVLYSKMWKTREAGSWLEETPDLNAPESRVSVKDILRSKARYLPMFNKKYRRRKKRPAYSRLKLSSDDDSDFAV